MCDGPKKVGSLANLTMKTALFAVRVPESNNPLFIFYQYVPKYFNLAKYASIFTKKHFLQPFSSHFFGFGSRAKPFWGASFRQGFP